METAAAPRTRHDRPNRVAPAVSLALIAIGGVVLTGWAIDSFFLKGLSGEITMKANAAVGLLASGLSLLLLDVRARSARTVGACLALFVALLGGFTLSEHIIGWDLGIDQLLFVEPLGAAATASPGRMGPNGALSLMLSGVALHYLYAGSERNIATAQIAAACVAVLALVPTVGYIYGAEQLYAIARVTGIAFHTGVSLLALSLGILAARAHAGVVDAVTNDAAHGVMARRLFVPAIIVPLLLGYARVFGQRRGWFDTGLGASMFVVAVIVLLVLTIWRTALALASSEGKRRWAEDALTETEQRFQSMADQAPVLIWVDEGGRRVWVNRRWVEFTGLPAGRSDWQTLVHPEDLPEYRAAFARAAAADTSYSHQYRLRRADGDYAWVLETASPRRPTRGSPGYVGSCVDVTALREAQQARDELLVRERAAREKAEQADRAKDEFIAVLSHELRTPLNAILGWMQMLQQGTVSEAGRARAIDAVARNAAALAQLIEDLLDTSRIATGHMELIRQPADLRTIVRIAVESVLPTAEQRGIEVRLTPAPALATVLGDERRLQQIVWNLLSNAIKFTPDGGRVDVRVWGDAETVAVTVRDQGVGIDPEFLPYVFDRFRQADTSPTRAQGGLGLGLYIARHLAELHGGTLGVEEAGAGAGAAFTLKIPAAAAAYGVTLDAAPPSAGAVTLDG